jgi:hypothetical protein
MDKIYKAKTMLTCSYEKKVAEMEVTNGRRKQNNGDVVFVAGQDMT